MALLPSISVIVPSFNQGAFLEETLLSIINQQYPNLQLIVVDGGSSDSSVEILRKYSKHISWWVSEVDRGQSHAINKGILKASGEWIGWLNSDDCYLSNSILPIFQNDLSEIDFIYGSCIVGPDIQNVRPGSNYLPDKDSLYDILKFFHAAKHIIPSQSVFLRNSLIEKIGLLREDLNYCMDLDWYCRVFITTGRRKFIEEPIAFYRLLPSTKTSSHGGKMIDEAIKIAEQYSSFLTAKERRKLGRLLAYDKQLFKTINNSAMNFRSAFQILLKWPFESIADDRFKSKLKALFLKN